MVCWTPHGSTTQLTYRIEMKHKLVQKVSATGGDCLEKVCMWALLSNHISYCQKLPGNTNHNVLTVCCAPPAQQPLLSPLLP